MIDKKEYNREDIESILQIYYYDRRTDYVWKYIMGDGPELENKLYPIPSLNSFNVMQYMQKSRNKSVSVFLAEWKEKSHPGLIDCTYNKRSGILRLKARSFDYTYHTKLNLGLFVTQPDIAKYIGLEDRFCKKRYRKSGMYTLAHLAELDEQLYSRYSEIEKVKEWKKSPQFDIDCQYCNQMIPYIMQDAESKKSLLGYNLRLNIILIGNDKVRIGIVRDYSPKEMIAMPVFPRTKWQEGIQSAFTALDEANAIKLEQRTKELQQWSQELSEITLGKTQFCLDSKQINYASFGDDSYTNAVLHSALGVKEEANKKKNKLDTHFLNRGLLGMTADVDTSLSYEYPTFGITFNTKERYATITLKPEIATALNYEIENKVKIPSNLKLNERSLYVFDYSLQDRYKDYITSEERKQRPQHRFLVEEVKYIIQISAPLLAYSGTNQNILDNYFMTMTIEQDDSITLNVRLSNTYTNVNFTLDDYRTAFRVWWSQLLLNECKYAKQCSLDPAHSYPFEVDLPF